MWLARLAEVIQAINDDETLNYTTALNYYGHSRHVSVLIYTQGIFYGIVKNADGVKLDKLNTDGFQMTPERCERCERILQGILANGRIDLDDDGTQRGLI